MNFSLRLKAELIEGAPRGGCCKAAYLRGLFLDAANECGIKGLKHARFNQDRRDMLRHYGNPGWQKPPVIYASKTLERD